MFVEAIEKTKKAMFPIISHGLRKIKKGKKNIHQFHINVNGTGFFISENGLFLTANHIISFVQKENLKLMYYGCLQESVEQSAKPISILYQCKRRDLCLGKIEVESKFLEIANENTPIGRSICTGGYPDSNVLVKHEAHNKFKLNIKNIKQYWHPSTIIGYEKERKFRSGGIYDAVILHEHGIKGISGGPIVDVSGTIAGLFTSDIKRGDRRHNSPLYTLNNSAGVAVSEIKLFLEEYKKGLTDIIPKAS